MDLLTLAMAKKTAAEDAAQALEDAKDYSDDNLETAKGYSDDNLNTAKGYTDSEVPVSESGQTTLTNTKKFPFNDSQKSVALAKTQEDINYTVTPEIVSAVGNPGEIVVSDKQVNGFKLAHTGSATSVVVKYIVIGGVVK